ncbi:ribonuclease 3-like isoform X3 [Hydractinia symbiolongicarpus]|nr:ribonuclease 3-like isoform X3 [Hydractinia symbiolongicarpus]XP_057289778.1 ribonuclease 3-like isoform X3 [Hydractinia symbiolongicarpus]
MELTTTARQSNTTPSFAVSRNQANILSVDKINQPTKTTPQQESTLQQLSCVQHSSVNNKPSYPSSFQCEQPMHVQPHRYQNQYANVPCSSGTSVRSLTPTIHHSVILHQACGHSSLPSDISSNSDEKKPHENNQIIGSKRKLNMKNERKKKKNRYCEPPRRGYVLENIKRKQTYISVGQDGFYTKESEKREDDINVSVCEGLLKLHHEFIVHRISLDEITPSCDNTYKTVQEKEILHPSIHYNQHPEDCDCKADQKTYGIHHNVFPGKAGFFGSDSLHCDPYSNNADRLYHYRLVIDPEINFTTRDPTTIYFDGKDFCFEGYSLFSHVSLEQVPSYLFLRNGVDYTIKFAKEPSIPEGFCLKDLDLICDYLFADIFELSDWCNKDSEDGCRQFHLMPRFVHRPSDSTKEHEDEMQLLSMARVLEYLMKSYTPFETGVTKKFTREDWKHFSKENRGCLVLNQSKKPRAIRVDEVLYPERRKGHLRILHSASSLKSTSKKMNKQYNDLTEQLRKAKRAVQSRPVPRKEDQELLWKVQEKVNVVKEQRCESKWKDIEINCEGYFNTGLSWDICQHSSYIPGVWKYLRFMSCLHVLEDRISYTFKDKSHLKNALTHPSYVDQSTLSAQLITMVKNLGKRHPHVDKTNRPKGLGIKKKGVINMTNVMATLFDEEQPKICFQNNERLEFLGDAVLDYLSSVHLFLMLSDKGPGKLSAFRSGLVRKDNLVKIAHKINLKEFILIDHRHNTTEKLDTFLADAVEALIGAAYLDGGINVADQLILFFFFSDDETLANVWKNLKKHPLQEEYPESDRHLINESPTLLKCVELESKTGVQFNHIRLLARALTHSAAGLDDPLVTGGNYERLEFLGDAIIKYVCSDYLYKRFPNHQEGHLTLLRTSLINAKCLSKAASELHLDNYIVYQSQREAMSVKEKVLCDVFEAFIGAVHVDQGIKRCHKIIEVCILQKLKEFIINQEWLDPKTQLQQCCYSVSDPKNSKNKKNDFVPVYKRLKETSEGGIQYFKVGVYCNSRRLGVGTGRSCKEAEKEAARDALRSNHFEQHARQKRIAYKRFGPRGSTSTAHESKQSEQRSFVESDNSHSKRRRTETSYEGCELPRFSSSKHCGRSPPRSSMTDRKNLTTKSDARSVVTTGNTHFDNAEFCMGKELQESDNDAKTLQSSDSSSDMDEGELYESVFDMGDKSDLFRG